MSITVTIKQVYGKSTIYPVCPIAKRFAMLLGQQTLTHTDLIHVRHIGFEIKQEYSNVEL